MTTTSFEELPGIDEPVPQLVDDYNDDDLPLIKTKTEAEYEKLTDNQKKHRKMLIHKYRTRLVIAGYKQAKEAAKAEEARELTVSEAITRHRGRVAVKGSIVVSISAPYKIITRSEVLCYNCGFKETKTYERDELQTQVKEKCPDCDHALFPGNYDYINARTIELQDEEGADELDRLTAVLFDNDSRQRIAGERVKITGDIMIKRNGKVNKLYPVVMTQMILFENRQELRIDDKDREAFKKFASFSCCPKWQLMDRLVAMTMPEIIGLEMCKKSTLLAAVGFADERNSRGRIHILFIGGPGIAKTMLLRGAVKLVPNSRYIGGKGSSGKSLIAIVDTERDTKILRLGPVVLAKNAIAGINEIGRMSFDDQGHLLDMMEEGMTTLTKYGISITLYAPTTVVASSNPIHSDWTDDQTVSDQEIPLIQPVRDRFDIILVMRGKKSEEESRKYAAGKSRVAKLHFDRDYRFLRKYLHHVRTSINPVMTSEAEFMLNEYWVALQAHGYATLRSLDTLKRIAIAWARLLMKDEVDASIAKEVMAFYNSLTMHFGFTTKATENPRDMTYGVMLEVVNSTQGGITVSEAARMACQRNPQVEHYLGDKLTMDRNRKLRTVVEMLVEKGKVNVIQMKPMTLISAERLPAEPAIPNGSSETTSYTSYTSDRNIGASDTKAASDLYDVYDARKFPCVICNKQFGTLEEALNHAIGQHKGKAVAEEFRKAGFQV